MPPPDPPGCRGHLATAASGAKSRIDRPLLLLIGSALGVSLANLAFCARHLDSLQPRTRNEGSPAEMERSLRRQRHRDRLESTQLINKEDNMDGINGDPRVYEGDPTPILTGERPFPESADGQTVRIKYRPGSLTLSRAEALRFCFVNATLYAHHIFDRPRSVVSLSERHKLIYVTIPKSSSSSSRHAMQAFLDGGDQLLDHVVMEDKVRNEGYDMISFIREPLDRFYSSYDEAFYRMGPWKGDGSLRPGVRKQYLDNKYRVEPYPYLYKGLTTLQDFRRLYCSKELLATGQLAKCNEVPSIDNGTLTARFERFVSDYSGLDPFDVHLHLQTGNLVFPTGEPLPLTSLYNATKTEERWREVARRKGLNVSESWKRDHGRAKARRFNKSLVTTATKQKICQMLALDYCCLNVELPVACRGKEHDAGGVYCAMERRDNNTMEHALTPVVIHAWRDPRP